ncbi:uncharacterized protein LOC127011563 isoform X1 [Drosophila biarmipes]|uniref:uncharacterized protein LOC127011563 isoform X1 n=1 Tax=Drosophila biarmipes TaxID=125945 RepID=UPI0021CCDA6A|nr:uncharacterized protein LOC127011563 isoform X1 [Drosophila biarmipes]XP_050744864.1 uncharacterized protein LOC127011563 isoform X1 [Drosophila biarmipes]
MEGQKTPHSENPADIPKVQLEIDISEMVQLLPTFDGDQYTLSDFIGSVQDMVLDVVKNVYKAECPVFIMRAIRRKIVGEANNVLIRERTRLNWNEIKETLIDNFADPRNMDTLMDDLRKIPYCGLSIDSLYVEISKIRCVCFDILERNVDDLKIRNNQEFVYEKRFLEVFVAGLRGPLQLLVVRKNPKTLREAKKYAIQLTDDFRRERNAQVSYSSRNNYPNKMFFNQNPRYHNGRNVHRGPNQT